MKKTLRIFLVFNFLSVIAEEEKESYGLFEKHSFIKSWTSKNVGSGPNLFYVGYLASKPNHKLSYLGCLRYRFLQLGCKLGFGVEFYDFNKKENSFASYVSAAYENIVIDRINAAKEFLSEELIEHLRNMGRELEEGKICFVQYPKNKDSRQNIFFMNRADKISLPSNDDVQKCIGFTLVKLQNGTMDPEELDQEIRKKIKNGEYGTHVLNNGNIIKITVVDSDNIDQSNKLYPTEKEIAEARLQFSNVDKTTRD
ncbi:hypothetical protein HYV10_02290 [Candidatus Dependentiae bacterium]|nr:hypothetical protein [Candidatus Dependentiae bacterium]